MGLDGKKLILLVGGFPTKENPARCIFNKRAALSLVDEGHDVHVVFFRLWRPGRKLKESFNEDSFKLTVLAIPSHPKFYSLTLWLFGIAAAKLIKVALHKAEIIHSVGASSMGIVGSFLAKKFRKRHVAQLIGSDVNSILPVIKNQLIIRNWEKTVHGVSANSLAILNAFNSLYPDISPNSIVNYRGVNLEHFVYTPIADHLVVILFLGGLPDYPTLPHRENTKGGETLMRVWTRVDNQINSDSQVKLVFGGPGSNKTKAISWQKSLRFGNKVEILGNVKPEEVKKLMAKCSLVVIPSKEEGTPNVGFEALASGRAILGSNVGGIPELIIQNRNGWILSPDDEESWYKHLLEIIFDKYDLGKMGQESRSLSEEKFSHNLFPKRLTGLYNKVLSD